MTMVTKTETNTNADNLLPSLTQQDEIKADAAKYFPEISAVLSRVPRQMLLIFKTNDLLRGIEFSLDTHKR